MVVFFCCLELFWVPDNHLDVIKLLAITSEADKDSSIWTILAIFITDEYYLNNEVAIT